MTDDRKPLGEYAIQGGAAEEHRLAVLAQVMSGATTRLFGEIGVTDGWVCLDVGSGGGQVSMALAGLVAPSGSVTGVDIGETAVVHAAASARELGVENVRFEQADAAALPYQDRFDLAYARLLLCYLTEPVAALRQMAAAVRPGGVVAVEDVFTDTLRSEPATPALDDLRRIYGATVRAHGGDPTIGPRLPTLFSAPPGSRTSTRRAWSTSCAPPTRRASSSPSSTRCGPPRWTPGRPPPTSSTP